MDYRERWELKEYQSEQRLGRRAHLLHAAIIVVLAGFLGMFWYLQIVRGADYELLAENNRLRRIAMPPTRGVVFDRHDEVLASTRPALNLVLVREGLQDADGQLRRLESVLGIPYEGLKERLTAMHRRPTFEPLVIKEDVQLAEIAKVEARREWFPSVEVEETALRDYPDGTAIAHAVGYVGEVNESQLARVTDGSIQQGDIVGKSGIERQYDDVLRGRRGWKLVTVNSLGRPFGPSQPGRIPEDGAPLKLTIDKALQRTLVEALADEVGSGIFMDPNTGAVLALASTPGYDPNVFTAPVSRTTWMSLINDPRRPLNDRAISSFYAPGSTFKVLMTVAGLESGAITPSTTVDCGGSVVIYGRPFLCWKKGGHGVVDVHRALVQSCNVFYYLLGKKMGIDTITKYAKMFNIGEITGIDIPGETRGNPPSVEWKQKTRKEPWYPGDTISVSIGQGLLAVTPIQMATMISAVANGGSLVKPHLARDAAVDPVRLPVSAETLAIIHDALMDVVEEGTATKAQLGPIHVAGKTGTAQVFKKSAGIDADKLPKDEKDHAWFVGYAPAEKPEIAFAIVIEHGGHGGTTAAPVAKKVLETFFADRLPQKPSPEEKPSSQLQAHLAAHPEGSGAPPATAR
ncbi:MAG TPA: penicillin-binding protein 2 [Candidatus Polarisedimenticolaceae bacterium]|nr:penicillin-binding protein 2 [Candidatus Polarisedimenticolaceae bacterium]